MAVLTEGQIIGRARSTASSKSITDLSSIQNLNLWGQNLTDVSALRRVQNIEVLSLAINSISSLAPFRDLPKLTELYLRRNNVSDFRELNHLRNLSNLRVLWLNENPVAQSPNYRLEVIRALPQLRKLDDRDITQQERNEAGVRLQTSNNDEASVSTGHDRTATSLAPIEEEQTPSVPATRPTWKGSMPRVAPETTSQADFNASTLGVQGNSASYTSRPRQEQHLQGPGLEIVSTRHCTPDGRIRHRPHLASNDTLAQQPQQPALSPSRPPPTPRLDALRGPNSGKEGSKRRASWLTNAGESGAIKERIRAVAMEPQDDNLLKGKTNNVLFAVLSLLKELDAPSLYVVGHELNRAIEERGM
ncbi:hypothetical protein HDU85_001871 [Gaertneriomyces sp. JEL0708]|nr:hypothetical protein HDU85_001871 [Gaertneriomyces sp. JEL0708]